VQDSNFVAPPKPCGSWLASDGYLTGKKIPQAEKHWGIFYA
jgi:hypothetical protein